MKQNKVILLTVLILLSFISFAQDDKKEDKLYSSSTYSGLKFRSVGPAFASGRIADIEVNPDNTKEMYVAVASGNVWKTSNAGITWKPIFETYGSYSTSDVAIDPRNTNIVWVGTGEYNSQRAIGYGDGVYLSKDGGDSFENMGLKKSEHIGRIVIDPRNSHVYVAAQGPLWGDGGDRGLYKSTDMGKTWDKILDVSENTGITDIIYNPSNPDELYCAAYQRRRHVWTLINGGEESAIYKSTDAGKTWEKTSSGLPSGDMGRIGLTISPVKPNNIYAVIEAEGESGGIFRSTNKGASWKKMNDRVSTSPQYYNRLYADPVNPDKIFSMDTWTGVSLDGGKTWNNLSDAKKHVDDHALWIDPNDTDHFWIGSDGGLYETYNHGADWRHIENLSVTQFYRVAVDNEKPFYNIYGGTQDNMSIGGPSRTLSQAGITNDYWFTTKGGDGFQSRIDPKNPNIVYSQSQYGWLVRYDKITGESVIIKPQPPQNEAYRWNWNSPLIISSHSNTRLYFAANKLFKSDNRGDTWEVISPDLTQQIDRNNLPVMGKIQSPEAVAKNSSTSLFGNITEITESPITEGLIYIGTDDGLVQVTEDDGKTWTKIDKFPDVPKNTYVSCLTASKHEANTVYATFDGRKQNNLKPMVLKSDNKGKTWKNITANLPERGTVYKIEQDYKNKNLLFAGTEFGFYFTIDEGENWIEFSNGLPTIMVRDIAIQEDEDDIVLATFGRSFYVLDDYSPLREITKDVIDSKGTLFQVSDALMFVESVANYGQGANKYSAKNPPIAAVFTYYLKEKPKTLKKIRKDKEKELAKEGKDIDYPSFAELQKEDEEEKAYLLFTISDMDGNIVRQLKKNPQAGLNRVTWNMKYSSWEPISKVKDNLQTGNSSFPVTPGKYKVKLSLFVSGELSQIGTEQEFSVLQLQNNTISRGDQKIITEFYAKVSDLSRVVFATDDANNYFIEKLKSLEVSLYATNMENKELLAQIKNVQEQCNLIKIKFEGNESISKRNANQVPSIAERLGILLYSFYRHTGQPTATMTEQYEIVRTEFKIELKKLETIEIQIEQIEQELEKQKAPYIKGRLPKY